MVPLVGYRPCRTNTAHPAAEQLSMPCCSDLQGLTMAVPQPLPSTPSVETYTAGRAGEEFAPLQTAAGACPPSRDGSSAPPQPESKSREAPSDVNDLAAIAGRR